MPTRNQAMRTLQSTLLRRFQKLHESLDNVTDADRADAIVREMQEINHRIAMAGGLLFAAQAAELDEKVVEIGKATRKVDAAIADLRNLQAFLEATSEFLGLVDQAIDLAKTL